MTAPAAPTAPAQPQTAAPLPAEMQLVLAAEQVIALQSQVERASGRVATLAMEKHAAMNALVAAHARIAELEELLGDAVESADQPDDADQPDTAAQKQDAT